MEDARDVLVVEDDKTTNKLLCRFFSAAGFSVRSALDGQTALRQAREKPPSVVLLDLMLPDITGYDVCTELKKDGRTGGVPVVMVTAVADDQSRQRGLACGAVEYVTKPFNPDLLVETVKRLAA